MESDSAIKLTKKELNKLKKKQKKKAAKERARVSKEKLSATENRLSKNAALVVYGGRKSVPVPLELLLGEKNEWLNAEPEKRPTVETDHVLKTYDSVADSWDTTRYKSWPKVAQFISSQPEDIGCGNGKNIPACNASGGFAVGSDFSPNLVGICVQKGFEVNVSDALLIPYRSNIFDAVLSIAVLHHISTEKRRIRLISENMRVLKVGGMALFYAWAFEQPKDVSKSGHKFKQQDVLVPFHRKNYRVSNKTPSNNHETDINPDIEDEDAITVEQEPENINVFQRYCHVYKEGELQVLFNHPTLKDWIHVEHYYYDTGNWCILAKKVSDHS